MRSAFSSADLTWRKKMRACVSMRGRMARKRDCLRVHQYFGIKAAQEHVRQKKGGIIWHTQGSGKSIVMVLLARWMLENNPNARVAIITDRDELDKQIERVFTEVGEPIKRTSSGMDLIKQLGLPQRRGER